MAIETVRVSRSSQGEQDRNVAYRVVSAALGLWVFVSAFLWRHAEPQRSNTWIVGILIACFAFVSMTLPRARFVNTLLAAWLFISAFALPSESTATMLTNALVGLVVFVVSLAPTTREVPLYHRHRMRTPVA